MALYESNSFISIPGPNDSKIKIFDKHKNLKYSVEPNVAFFFTVGNNVIIKINNENDINLDFATAIEASIAIKKLNDVQQALRKTISQIKNSSLVESKSNLNMTANVTHNDGDLACSTAIIDIPYFYSYVKVFVNGMEVNCGGKSFPNDCYFSYNGGFDARIVGDERRGDLLYWNSSVAGYNLDASDQIDFVYFIEIDNGGGVFEDTSLNTAISMEIVSRISNDDIILSTIESLTTALSAEISLRISSDFTPLSTIESLSALLSFEISSTISSDNSLSTLISTEISSTISSDNSLSSLISTETSSRISSIGDIASLLDEINGIII